MRVNCTIRARLARFAIREYRMVVPLKPQDVVVALKLAAHPGEDWSYPKLAADLSMSASEVHSCVKRAAKSGLLLANDEHKPNRKALLEFLTHGIKYAFPAERRGLT